MPMKRKQADFKPAPCTALTGLLRFIIYARRRTALRPFAAHPIHRPRHAREDTQLPSEQGHSAINQSSPSPGVHWGYGVGATVIIMTMLACGGGALGGWAVIGWGEDSTLGNWWRQEGIFWHSPNTPFAYWGVGAAPIYEPTQPALMLLTPYP